MKDLSLSNLKKCYEDSPDTDFYKYSLARLVFRPLSFYFALLAIKLKISPNQITFISWIAVLLGCFNYAFQIVTIEYFSFCMIMLWALLDYVDGSMARFLCLRSDFGHFIDIVGAYFLFAFLPLGISIGSDNKVFHELINSINNYWQLNIPYFSILAFGAISATSNLLLRLILLRGQVELGINVRQNKEEKKSTTIINWVEALASPRGIFFPILLLAEIFKILDYFIILYAIYYFFGLVIYTILYCYKNSNK